VRRARRRGPMGDCVFGYPPPYFLPLLLSLSSSLCLLPSPSSSPPPCSRFSRPHLLSPVPCIHGYVMHGGRVLVGGEGRV